VEVVAEGGEERRHVVRPLRRRRRVHRRLQHGEAFNQHARCRHLLARFSNHLQEINWRRRAINNTNATAKTKLVGVVSGGWGYNHHCFSSYIATALLYHLDWNEETLLLYLKIELLALWREN
jgi:hypothetical protein